MKTIIKICLASFVTVVFISSCTKKPVIENTSTYKMSGEWFTRYYSGGAALTSHHKILTYNTSDPASNQVWVEDPNVWPFRAKFDVDYPAQLFKAVAAATNLSLTGEKIKVYEGKVITNGGRSKTGVIVDSIYLKVEFTDDPGVIYEIRGHQRTGFFEDEY